MIIFDFRCTRCGTRFEKFVRTEARDLPVSCVLCAGASLRLPGFSRLGGSADPGPSREQMPRSWNGLNGADPSTLDGWRQIAARRDKLEEKYPELAGDRRPVLAHEGIFAQKPLREGDPLPLPAKE